MTKASIYFPEPPTQGYNNCEIEFDAAPLTANPRGASVVCSVAGCIKQASFIVHKAAYCVEHRKLVAS